MNKASAGITGSKPPVGRAWQVSHSRFSSFFLSHVAKIVSSLFTNI